MRIVSYDVENNENQLPVLMKESSTNYVQQKTAFSNPKDIVAMFNSVFHMDKKAEEHVYMMCCDKKNHPIGIFLISKGTVDASFANPREIMIRALLCGCVNMVMIHNHPSGESAPSVDDLRVYRRLKEVCNLMGMNLLDNLIIGREQYTSFVESGFAFVESGSCSET